MRDAESAARASLVRGTAIYGALLVAALGAIVWIVTNAASGAVVISLVFVGAIALLLAYQEIQHLRDLGAQPVERVGVIARKWSRADLIIAWYSYYVIVDRKVFQLTPEQHLYLEEGQRVRLVHFPHTLRVISAERVPEGG